MAIVVRLLPPQNIEAILDNRVWTCDDELVLRALTSMTALFQRSMGYAPDPDWPIAQEAIQRYSATAHGTRSPGSAAYMRRLSRRRP